MNNNFNLDELEDFLSETVEDHRMYPSDRVWRNIDQELHGNKRWPALTFGAILTGAIILAGLLLVKPDKNLFNTPIAEAKTAATIAAQKTVADHINATSQQDIVPLAAANYKNGATKPSIISSFAAHEPLAVKSNTHYYVVASEAVPTATQQANFEVDVKAPSIQHHVANVLSSSVTAKTPASVIAKANTHSSSSIEQESDINKTLEEMAAANAEPSDNEELAALMADSNFTEEDFLLATAQHLKEIGVQKPVVETPKINRWGFQYYVTPSISYRYLDETKITDMHLSSGGPIAPNLTNGVNNFVRHNSNLGVEAGAAVTYNVTPGLRLKAGLQFNYRSYNIEAFAASYERSTILLNRGVYTDSIIRYSPISNQGGSPMELTNKYYQLAIPVGFDLRIAGTKKLQLWASATIQPTYQFNKSIYILSTDYKNYLQQPDLVRNWNMNTSLEAFISYELKKGTSLQVGPQLRYQLIPGTIKQYPIKEHLMDWGLKIGVVKSFK